MALIPGAREWLAGLFFDKGGAVFNVKHPDFGAKGDGVTNDTAAFAACMAAISANGGGDFYMPRGTYKADFPAPVSNCTIRGAGRGATMVNANSVLGQLLGSDISNVTIEKFTFVGLSASGVNNTNIPIWIKSVAADIENIRIRKMEFRDFKCGEVIRISGNGDLVTTATKFAKDIEIVNNKVSLFYDLDPASQGQEAACIYLFGGIQDTVIEKNNLDCSFCKQGVFIQTDATRVSISRNNIKNCGLINNNVGSHAVICYSSYASSSISQVSVTDNRIDYTARAAIYFVAVSKYVVANNTIYRGDANGLGLGNVGSGAIMINNSTNDARNGVGIVSHNTIVDPGKIGIYIDTLNFQLSECLVVGNVLKMTFAQTGRIAIVLFGRGIVLDGNTLIGFTQNFYLYTIADNDLSDITIVNNQVDATIATGSRSGITWNALTMIGPMVVSNNRFRAVELMADIRKCTDLNFTNNIGIGAPFASGCILFATRGLIRGNILDTGTTGLNIQTTPATATARIRVEGNIVPAAGWVTPCLVTENTGVITVVNNEGFGTIPGVSADVGDAALASGLNQPVFEVFRWSTTLTANRTATQSAAKCFRGDKRRIVRDAAVPGAFTLAVVDNLGATLYTIPASNKGFADLYFDGANWKLAGAGTFA